MEFPQTKKKKCVCGGGGGRLKRFNGMKNEVFNRLGGKKPQRVTLVRNKTLDFFPIENGKRPEAFEQSKGKNSARHQEVKCVPNK